MAAGLLLFLFTLRFKLFVCVSGAPTERWQGRLAALSTRSCQRPSPASHAAALCCCFVHLSRLPVICMLRLVLLPQQRHHLQQQHSAAPLGVTEHAAWHSLRQQHRPGRARPGRRRGSCVSTACTTKPSERVVAHHHTHTPTAPIELTLLTCSTGAPSAAPGTPLVLSRGSGSAAARAAAAAAACPGRADGRPSTPTTPPWPPVRMLSRWLPCLVSARCGQECGKGSHRTVRRQQMRMLSAWPTQPRPWSLPGPCMDTSLHPYLRLRSRHCRLDGWGRRMRVGPRPHPCRSSCLLLLLLALLQVRRRAG